MQRPFCFHPAIKRQCAPQQSYGSPAVELRVVGQSKRRSEAPARGKMQNQQGENALTHNGNAIGISGWDTLSLSRTVPTLQDVA